MMTVELKHPDMLALNIDGEIDAETMAVVLDEMISLSTNIENGKLFYTIRNFEMPTLAALAVEIKKLPSLFALIMKFDRAAVLSDVEWIKKAAWVEGLLIPGLEIQTFDLDQEAEALAFLNEVQTVGT